MRFNVRAVRDSGIVETFECEALDEGDALRQARARGYTVLRLSPGALLGRRRAFPLLLFSQDLAALLVTGLPLLEAVETLQGRERAPERHEVLTALAAALRSGKSLSAALAAQPAIFPQLYVATARASEQTGDLATALSRYNEYRARLDAVAKKVVNALVYPAVLLAVGGAVTLFLLVYVVPRFSAIYQERASDLPFLSRVMLEWGAMVRDAGWLVVLAGLAALTAVVALARHPRAQALAAALVLRWPSAAEWFSLYQLVRFYRTVGMLLAAGMPAVRALEMAAGVLHPGLQQSLQAATQAVREGKPIAPALEAHGLATSIAARMLAVGEKSGNVGAMLERAAAFHEEELSRWIERFSRLFEPALMAAVGVVVGLIVVLMYLPIFELAGSVR